MAGKRDARRGFTLVEVLVALALVGLGLMMTLALLAEEPRIDRRLRAHAEAVRALDWGLETVRGGALPSGLGGGPVPLEGLYGDAEKPAAGSLQVVATIQPQSIRGLLHLQLTARYQVQGRWFERSVETYMWRPTR